MRNLVAGLMVILVFTAALCFALAMTRTLQAPHAPCETTSAPDKQITLNDDIWTITAYCPCERCCGEYADGITASGAKAVGKIVAAPPEIPFGTEYYFEGYGHAVVRDRGGAFKNGIKKLDLLFSRHQDAINWGKKYMEKRGNIFIDRR